MVPPNEPEPSDSLLEMVVLPPTILQSLLCIEIELSAEHSLKASLPTVAMFAAFAAKLAERRPLRRAFVATLSFIVATVFAELVTK